MSCVVINGGLFACWFGLFVFCLGVVGGGWLGLLLGGRFGFGCLELFVV